MAKPTKHYGMWRLRWVECEGLIDAFVEEYQPKYPKATQALTTESDKLLTHFELPAEH